MADLTGTTPADTYKSLLQIGDATNGVDATAKYIEDGEGTDSALAISTTAVGIGTDNPSATLQIDATDNSTNALAFWVRDVSRTNSIISAYENGNVKFGSFMYEDSGGNLGLGNVSTFGVSATNTIAIKEGVAPTSSPSNIVQLFCEEVSSSAELRVRNENGIVTTLSPHAKDAPSSLYDRPPGVEEMHRSANHYLGTIVFTNVDRRNALLQKQLNGEELPEDRTFTVTETFAEYNTRTGADLQVEDWDANQQAMFDAQEEKVVARQAEIDAWDNEEEAPEPLQSYVKKPKPDWLS
jgi:hypothetical protein